MLSIIGIPLVLYNLNFPLWSCIVIGVLLLIDLSKINNKDDEIKDLKYRISNIELQISSIKSEIFDIEFDISNFETKNKGTF